MNKYILTVLNIIITFSFFSQEPHTDYLEMDTLRIPYSEMLDWNWEEMKKSKCYKDGKKVNCKVYKPYIDAYKTYSEGCPFVYEQKDESNNYLMTQTVSCSDCYVGEYKEFYSGGALKIHGIYKRNLTGIWPPMKGSFPCNIKHGPFTYFNFSSDTLLKVIWFDNKIIDYYPRKTTDELINNEIKFNNKLLNNHDTIYVGIKDSLYLPSLFKSKDSLDVEIKVEVYSTYFYEKFKCNLNYNSNGDIKLIPLYDILKLMQKMNTANKDNLLTINLTYLINNIYITSEVVYLTAILE